MRDINIYSLCNPKQWKTISGKNILESGRYPVYGANGIIGYYDEYNHENETLLITCRGATCGKVNISVPFSYVNGNAMALDNLSEEVHLKYLYYYLQERGFTDIISGSAQPQITKTGLKKLQIPLPDLPTQKAIAARLDQAEAVKNYNQELLGKYDQLGQAIFLEMFGDPVKNEMGWEVIKLEDVGRVSSGSTPSRKNKDNFIGSIPWVKTGEVRGEVIFDTEEKISDDALKNSSCRLYSKGSLIIAMYGQGKTRGQVGMLGVDASTNQACAVIPYSKKINFKFLYELLKISYKDLRRLGRGGNQPNLNVSLVKNYFVLNPPLDLQTAFARRIENIEHQKAFLRQEIDKSEELFNSLLQESFRFEEEAGANTL